MLRAQWRWLTYASVIVALLVAPAARGAAPSAVTILGVERDPRFGRAWLLAQLSEEGHLRTVSGNLKAFAPPGEYEGGFVRIPLIPKLPLAERLRRTGHATVTVTVYFDPSGGPGVTVRRQVGLVRTVPRGPAPADH